MAQVENIQARITELRYKRDRLAVIIMRRKSMAASRLLTMIARAKLNRQILAKTKLVNEIQSEIERLANKPA